MTGQQDAILEMTIGAVNALVTVGDADDDELASGLDKRTTATSTATSLPFGVFRPVTTTGQVSKTVAQTINVKTNGTTGYTASVAGDSPDGLTSNAGANSISYVATSTNWIENATTGFGVNAQNGEAITGTFGTVGGNDFSYHPIAPALNVANAPGPTAGANTTVVFRVQIPVTQAAGDYTGNIDYTVLPGF